MLDDLYCKMLGVVSSAIGVGLNAIVSATTFGFRCVWQLLSASPCTSLAQFESQMHQVHSHLLSPFIQIAQMREHGANQSNAATSL